MAGEITEVARDAVVLGMVKINHKARGYSYHYYLGEGLSLKDGAARIGVVVGKLGYLIPLGAEIKDAFAYRPDPSKMAISGMRNPLASLSTKIITPAAGDPDAGFVANDHRTCLHMDIYTKGWRGREFFRTPPDGWVTDDLWTGPELPSVDSTTAPVVFTVNTSTAAGKVDGTWVERLKDYYYYIFTTFLKEWRLKVDGAGLVDQNVIEVSPYDLIQFKRVTSHKMGRAFLP